MKRLIHGGTIINEGRMFTGDILVSGDKIESVTEGPADLPEEKSGEGEEGGKTEE